MSTTAQRTGTLHVEKECSEYTGEAGSFCTIASSNFDAIPAGSKVVYSEAATAEGGLDSDIVVKTPGGDTVHGHVVLDGATQTGTVNSKVVPGSSRNSRRSSSLSRSTNPATAGTVRTRTRQRRARGTRRSLDSPPLGVGKWAIHPPPAIEPTAETVPCPSRLGADSVTTRPATRRARRYDAGAMYARCTASTLLPSGSSRYAA
jgi:hypothetical protein